MNILFKVCLCWWDRCWGECFWLCCLVSFSTWGSLITLWMFYLRCVCADRTVTEESAPSCAVWCLSLHGDHWLHCECFILFKVYLCWWDRCWGECPWLCCLVSFSTWGWLITLWMFYLRCICVDGTVAQESALGCAVWCLSLHGDDWLHCECFI